MCRAQQKTVEHLLFGVGRQSWVSSAPISLGPKGKTVLDCQIKTEADATLNTERDAGQIHDPEIMT